MVGYVIPGRMKYIYGNATLGFRTVAEGFLKYNYSYCNHVLTLGKVIWLRIHLLSVTPSKLSVGFWVRKVGVADRKRDVNKHREGDTSRQEEHESDLRGNSMYIEPFRQDEARGVFSLI